MAFRDIDMQKIQSFKVNHLKLQSGLYVSRKDENSGVMVTTFDLRFTAPNVEPVIDQPALHAIEHLGATFFRNSKIKDKVIYFGPLGCRTGFYFVLFGDLTSRDVYDDVIECLDFIINYDGKIPGASPIECGNYLELNLEMAKYYARNYKNSLIENNNFEYKD